MELGSCSKYYVSKNCKQGGKQVTNLSPSQVKGLKSLRKRVAEGELVIIPTDKSGRLAVMSRDSYRAAGMKHTLRDRVVTWDDIWESQ